MTLSKKQVIKLYVDNCKEYDPPATKQDIKNAIEMAKSSYAENELSVKRWNYDTK